MCASFFLFLFLFITLFGGVGGWGGGSDVFFKFIFIFLSAEVVVTRLVAPQTAAVSAHVQCTPYNHAPIHIQSHISRVHVYGEAGTCHPHLSQKDRDLYVLLRG